MVLVLVLISVIHSMSRLIINYASILKFFLNFDLLNLHNNFD